MRKPTTTICGLSGVTSSPSLVTKWCPISATSSTRTRTRCNTANRSRTPACWPAVSGQRQLDVVRRHRVGLERVRPDGRPAIPGRHDLHRQGLRQPGVLGHHRRRKQCQRAGCRTVPQPHHVQLGVEPHADQPLDLCAATRLGRATRCPNCGFRHTTGQLVRHQPVLVLQDELLLDGRPAVRMVPR